MKWVMEPAWSPVSCCPLSDHSANISGRAWLTDPRRPLIFSPGKARQETKKREFKLTGLNYRTWNKTRNTERKNNSQKCGCLRDGDTLKGPRYEDVWRSEVAVSPVLKPRLKRNVSGELHAPAALPPEPNVYDPRTGDRTPNPQSTLSLGIIPISPRLFLLSCFLLYLSYFRWPSLCTSFLYSGVRFKYPQKYQLSWLRTFGIFFSDFRRTPWPLPSTHFPVH